MKFEELLAGGLDWLARLARRYYADKARAEDLLGETVCRMLEHSDMYSPDLPFRPWAMAVMRNIYITEYNRRMLAPMRPMEEWMDVGGGPRPDTCAEVGEVLTAIARLSEGSVCVMAVRLYAVDGMTYDEVAASMGVGVDVVRTRIAFGRRLLRRVLGMPKRQ